MNFLAHALLGSAQPALRVGGLAGDFVKGVLPAGLPSDLAQGVALHRAIDVFADEHPAFLRSRARIGPVRRRYAGVLVDMFYDHLLARHWASFSAVGLEAFSEESYRLVAGRLGELPARFQSVFEWMREDDWLQGYAQRSRVGGAIDRMAEHRVRRENPLAGGIEELVAAEAGFEADFLAFFPDAQRFADRWSAVSRGEV